MSFFSFSLSGAALAAVGIVMLVRAAPAENGLSADQREQELAVLMPCVLTVQSRHVTDSLITVAIEEGAAESMAVLIDSMDFARADWRPFERSFTVDLGPGDGRRELWLGVRSKSGLEYRRMTWVEVDTTAPQVTITSPSSTDFGTSQPVIQVKGHCPEALRGIWYDVSNAEGVMRNLQGFTVDQVFDRTTHELATNRFQCFDVALANGTNTITLRTTDHAGNTSTNTLAVTFDPSGDFIPPRIVIHWPSNGMKLAGDAFTLRGQLDDPTARVEVTGLGAASIRGIVERNGLFWVEDLPLATGSNTLTFTATDAAGNQASEVLTVVGTDTRIEIDEIPDEDYADSKVTVSGTVNSSAYALWVNGVRAVGPVPSGSVYRWVAEDVPLLDIGTAVIEVRAIALTDNDGKGHDNAGVPTLQFMGNPTANDPGDARKPGVPVQSPGLQLDEVETPEWVAGMEKAITEELERHSIEPRPRTNLTHLEAACGKAFRQWPTPPGISRSPWKDHVLEIWLRVLKAAVAERDAEYDLARSDPFQMRVMPRVTNEQFDVYPGMNPDRVRDPEVRKEYEAAIAENAVRRARWEREHRLEELIGFGVFRTATYVRVAYPEMTSAKRRIEVIRQFLDDADLIDRFEREFDR
jgi:hypothetical protein